MTHKSQIPLSPPHLTHVLSLSLTPQTEELELKFSAGSRQGENSAHVSPSFLNCDLIFFIHLAKLTAVANYAHAPKAGGLLLSHLLLPQLQSSF